MGSKIDAIIAQVNKEWKEEIASKGIHRPVYKRIPFTSPRLNYMLYGGIPRGKIIEFAGEENGGKTTSALDVCGQAQKLFIEEFEAEMSNENTSDTRKKYLASRGPQKVAYADCENTLDEDWAATLGVDVDDLIILKPQTQAAEDIFQILLDMMETDEIGLAVVDSLGVMMSKQAYEKDMTEKTYGGISMPLTLFSKKAELLCAKYNITLIGINQMRDDLNSMYGGQTTTGGRGWKHNCSLRMMFGKGDYIDECGNKLNRSCDAPAGNKVMVSIVKNKICKPDRKTGYYTLNYTYGVDEVADLVEVGLKTGIINKGGAWFQFVDPETGEVICDEEGKPIKIQGQVNVNQFLRDNEEFFEEFKNSVINYIS